MRRAISVVTVLLVIAASTVAAQDKAKTAKEEPKSKSGHEMAKGSGGSDAAKITRAMSAAPPSISKNATIMEMGADGKMNQLKAGTNGWMCLLEPNATIFFNLGMTYYKLGRRAEAVSALRHAARGDDAQAGEIRALLAELKQ